MPTERKGTEQKRDKVRVCDKEVAEGDLPAEGKEAGLSLGRYGPGVCNQRQRQGRGTLGRVGPLGDVHQAG